MDTVKSAQKEALNMWVLPNDEGNYVVYLSPVNTHAADDDHMYTAMPLLEAINDSDSDVSIRMRNGLLRIEEYSEDIGRRFPYHDNSIINSAVVVGTILSMEADVVKQDVDNQHLPDVVRVSATIKPNAKLATALQNPNQPVMFGMKVSAVEMNDNIGSIIALNDVTAVVWDTTNS